MEKIALIAALVIAVAVGLTLPGPGGKSDTVAASQFATLDIG